MKKIATLLTIALAGFSVNATAQADFPSKPIQFFVGFAPGGATDLIARVLAREANTLFGWTVIVVNRIGASATIAVTTVAAAQSDGHTLGVTPNSPFTTVHFLQRDLPADLLERTTPLLAVGSLRQALLVKGDSPLHTVKDMIEQARRNPGKVSVGTPTAGSGPSLAIQEIALQEKVELTVTPFPGEAPVMTALLGGHITAAGISAPSWERHVASGALRIIAAMNEDRLNSNPNVPTLAEQGFTNAGLSIFFMYGPRGLRKEVAKRLMDGFGECMRTAAYLDLVTKNAMDIKTPLSGEALERYLVEDRARSGRLIEKLGMKKS